MTIKAIETRYAGCRFRSRLEARWAVFFDHLGVAWEHEPQGYDTPAGRYLPDFMLHLSKPTLLEVKPLSDLGLVDERWRWAAPAAGARILVAYGLPAHSHLEPSLQSGNGQLNLVGDPDSPDGTWDNYYAFCLCPVCGAVGAEFDGRGGRVCTTCCTDDKDYTFDAPRIAAAYNAARSARFEHGQRG